MVGVIVMNVRFIDTSIMTNLLDIPSHNENRDSVKREFKIICSDPAETLILPTATIIETGNHIAQINNGNVRRNRAEKFSEYLLKTAQGEAPWTYQGYDLTTEDLVYLSGSIVEYATRGISLGDLSIIKQYEKYKAKVPSIGRIMIWCLDGHLKGYYEEDVSMHRRRDR